MPWKWFGKEQNAIDWEKNKPKGFKSRIRRQKLMDGGMVYEVFLYRPFQRSYSLERRIARLEKKINNLAEKIKQKKRASK